MRYGALAVAGLLLFGAVGLSADEGKPNLSGSWKLAPGQNEAGQSRNDVSLLIDEKGDNIHVKETRGPDSKDDVSEFTCTTLGKECAMQDGGDKATVLVYYNGPLLVILKTHGRKGSVVEKQRLSLSPAGDALNMEVMRLEPESKTEKLTFAKAQ